MFLYAPGAGLTLVAALAAGIIKFATGGTAEIARFDAAGGFVVGAKAAAATGLLEVYSATASPIVTITAASNTNTIDPCIAFRTEAALTQRAILGIDHTDLSFHVDMLAGAIGARNDFVMNTSGYASFGAAPLANTQMQVSHIVTNISGDNTAYYFNREITTASGTHYATNFYCQSEGFVSAGQTNSGILVCGNLNALARNEGTLEEVNGLLISFGKYTYTGQLNKGYGIKLLPLNLAGSTTDYLYGLSIGDPGVAGTINNGYPIYSAWNAQSVFVGGITILSDSNSAKYGAGSDAAIMYDGTDFCVYANLVGSGSVKFKDSSIFIEVIKSGATQGAAGAAAGEVWKSASHATLPDNVLLIGV
jgi:hypothetical protein